MIFWFTPSSFFCFSLFSFQGTKMCEGPCVKSTVPLKESAKVAGMIVRTGKAGA